MNNFGPDSDINIHFMERYDKYNDKNTWVYNESILEAIYTLAISSNISDQSTIHIADLGAGTCIVSEHIFNNLSDKYKTQVIAVDINEKMLSKCNNNAIIKIVSSIDKLPFVNSYFDVIVSRQCLHYISDIDNTIHEIKRVLKSNGIFVLAQIVPYDSSTRSYWSEIVNVRQPLRQLYYDEDMWDACLKRNGFLVEDSLRFTTRSSFKDWVIKYNIQNNKTVDCMKTLLEHAPDEYVKKYNIQVKDNDISYDSHWFVKKYILQ